MRPKHIKETRQQFIERTVRENLNPEQCWIWQFGQAGGYGIFAYAPNPETPSLKRCEKAQRFAYFLRYGDWPMPLGRHMCPGGGTSLCFNPSHIIAGTDAENAADRDAAGRLVTCVGSANASAKLNEELVLQMRLDSQFMSQRKLAVKYGIERASVHRILRGESWAHVDVPPETRVQHPEMSARLGEDNGGGGKLTTVDIVAICASTDKTADLARRYGVSNRMIWIVRTRRAWKHVDTPSTGTPPREGMLGDSNPAAKVTPEMVRKIRQLYSLGNISQSELGKRFGIRQAHVSCIVRRTAWTHIERVNKGPIFWPLIVNY